MSNEQGFSPKDLVKDKASVPPEPEMYREPATIPGNDKYPTKLTLDMKKGTPPEEVLKKLRAGFNEMIPGPRPEPKMHREPATIPGNDKFPTKLTLDAKNGPPQSGNVVANNGRDAEPPTTINETERSSERSETTIIGASVRGASHERNGLPNQDSITYRSADNGDHFVSVADGHGSHKAFRSDRGSRFATEVMTEQLEALAEAIRDDRADPLADATKENLARMMVTEWQKRVDEDRAAEDFTTEELATLRTKLTERMNTDDADDKATKTIDAIKAHPETAYGSTLLSAAFINNEYLVLVKLGDGNIVMIDNDSNPTQPIADDPRFIANETTSLSDGKPKEMQVIIMKVDPNNMPRMISLSTDGVYNAIGDEGLRGYATAVDKLDDRVVSTDLPGWLGQASESENSEGQKVGSGDDVTCGLLRFKTTV